MNSCTMYNASMDSEKKIFFQTMRNLTGLILYPIFCCFGLTINIVCIFVLTRKKMRSTSRIFILGLTISDSIHVLNDLLYFVCLLVNVFDVKISTHMIDYVYPYTNYVFHVTVTYSAWMTVSIATERYVNVCHSKRALYIITYTRGVIALMVIAVVTLIISVPHSVNMFYLVTSHLQNVSFQAKIRRLAFGNIFNACYYTVRFIVPVLCLVTFSSLIIYRLKDVRIRNGKRRITINLILAVSSFIVCTTPEVIVSAISRFHGTTDLLQGISEMTNFILLLNCSINAIIYCGLNKRFMAALKKFCRRSWMELAKFKTTGDLIWSNGFIWCVNY